MHPSPTALRNLPELLDALDPEAPAVERHLWLIWFLAWIRGDANSIEVSLARVSLFLDALGARPVLADRARACWQLLWQSLDMGTLLADHGFTTRHAFVSEMAERLRLKLLPATPETGDAMELFSLALCRRHDARWIAALDESLLTRLASLLPTGQAEGTPTAGGTLTVWQSVVLEAITYCTSQVRATGFAPELRLRMSTPLREAQPFHDLTNDFELFRDAFLNQADVQAPLQNFRERLDLCRQAAATVYTHLDEHGISVNLVFRLRQLRERVLRIRTLLDCLTSADAGASAARLWSHLVIVGRDRRSLRALLLSNMSLLAAKVTERSSETGEHYITRTGAEYRDMFAKAAGGGAITALTTWLKFGVVALALSPFWGGFWSGLVYAGSFVAIGLLQWTLATKQPALTAPAMAARLKQREDAGGLEGFVDEVTHLVRSQVVAVLGNVLAVVPAVVALSLLVRAVTGADMLSPAGAAHVFESLSLRGPTLLYATFTGVLLFACSLMAGWAENWFVLHRLQSAICYNPRITALLGPRRALRWAGFIRSHISSLTSNVSLGFMLGLIPAFALFFGLALEVRHVTLSAGQLAAACAALGWAVFRMPEFWWCVASIPLIGALNLGVSFYLAFRLALGAHSVSREDRGRIRAAIWLRWRTRPLSFIVPGTY
jgi:site-specific recombinase